MVQVRAIKTGVVRLRPSHLAGTMDHLAPELVNEAVQTQTSAACKSEVRHFIFFFFLLCMFKSNQ